MARLHAVRSTETYGCSFGAWLVGELRAARPVRLFSDQFVSPTLALSEMIIPSLLADAKLAAPRARNSPLDVAKASAELRAKPLPLEAALDRFYEELSF